MRALPWIAALAGAGLLAACGQKEEAAAPAAENVAAVENVTAAPAAAPTDPASAIKARQDHMKEVGKNMKAISDELKKDAPDVAVIKTSAAALNDLAPQVKDWFPPGTGPDSGIETDAKAEIWSKPEDFAAKDKAFVDGAAAFNTAAQGGDLVAIKAAMPGLGGACKGCHEGFKADKKKK